MLPQSYNRSGNRFEGQGLETGEQYLWYVDVILSTLAEWQVYLISSWRIPGTAPSFLTLTLSPSYQASYSSVAAPGRT